MKNNVVTGAILIEANGAALNNAGNDAGQRLDNAVVVKQIRIGRTVYPYISGQAVRRWWREVLYTDFAWEPSPVTRQAKSAYTAGDPVKYPDDDIFGYMAARKAVKTAKGAKQSAEAVVADQQEEDSDDQLQSKASTETEGGTQKRISPLKNSLLVAVLPGTTPDFGHFSRSLPVDNPNPVLYEHQHYTSAMQGVFTLSLTDVGRFACGLNRELPLNTPLGEGVVEIQAQEGNLKPRMLGVNDAERRKRMADTLRALGRLQYGANLARNLSDVAPVVLLIGFLDGGNAPFQNLFIADPSERERVQLNLDRLVSVVKDYKDRIVGGSSRLYFGYRPGVLSRETETLEALRKGIEGVSFFVGTPGEAISQVAQVIEKTADLF